MKGFLDKFARTAQSTADFLNDIAQFDIPMVGVDASLLLVYRDEYTKTLAEKRGEFSVLAVHEWLSQYASDGVTQLSVSHQPTHTLGLFTHCTEKTALPLSEKQWQVIFGKLNVPLDIVSVGCCGMAGTYGHESSHLANSQGIYALSWESAVAKYPEDARLVTGYSCRSQVARLSGDKPVHPLQMLNRIVS